MPSGIFTLKQQELALGQGAWTNQKPLAVDYLVVAGGGGGGSQSNTNSFGGGGGAGGLLQGNIAVATGSSITVTIGSGGTASANSVGTVGGNSVFGAITANGGGYGGRFGDVGAGGSGGGNGNYPFTVAITSGGQGISGQGNKGGDGTTTQTTTDAAGGGGGAGTVGLNGGSGVGGNGGAGAASDISGTRTTYAGGGGGSGYSTQGAGGAGGGGAAAIDATATNGTANTGGGGGGGGRVSSNGTGGSGGSGIVIISYPDTYAAPASTTGSPTVSTSGSGNLSFNGSSQTVSTAASSLLALGSGSFTIEYWVKVNGSGSFSRTFLITGSATFSIENNTYTSNVTPYYLNYGGTQTAVTTGSSFDVTQWHHVAIVRNSTTLRVYLNGVQAMSVTDSTNYSSNGTLYLGSNNSNNWLNGYVTNFRLVKGTAVYTAAFTPPTAPLTAISGTSILVSAVSGSFLADSSGNGLTFTNTGSTPWNSDSPFATGLGYKNRVYTWTSSGSITF